MHFHIYNPLRYLILDFNVNSSIYHFLPILFLRSHLQSNHTHHKKKNFDLHYFYVIKYSRLINSQLRHCPLSGLLGKDHAMNFRQGEWTDVAARFDETSRKYKEKSVKIWNIIIFTLFLIYRPTSLIIGWFFLKMNITIICQIEFSLIS